MKKMKFCGNPRYFHELLSAGNKIFIQKEILYLNILDAMLITPRLHVVFYNYNLLERVGYLDIPWDCDIDLVQALAREVIIYSYADQANDSIFFKLESFDKIIRRFFSSTEYPVPGIFINLNCCYSPEVVEYYKTSNRQYS